MKYRVITARNPKTGGTLLRPVVTDRNTMSMKQLVDYAKKANFVRGQQKDLEGLLGGFIEAMKDRAEAGYSINVKDWFIISGQLRGTVGEDRSLTAANDYRITITPTKDLQVGIDQFSWTNVEDTGLRVKIDGLLSPNGKPGQIVKTKQILLTGKNLQFDAALGDTMTITYEGLTTPISITPTESDYVHQLYAWPTLLADVDPETELTFKLTSRGGISGAAAQVNTKLAILKAA